MRVSPAIIFIISEIYVCIYIVFEKCVGAALRVSLLVLVRARVILVMKCLWLVLFVACGNCFSQQSEYITLYEVLVYIIMNNHGVARKCMFAICECVRYGISILLGKFG